MRISQQHAHDPLLKRLSVLVNISNRILETVRDPAPPAANYGNRGRVMS
jgi:hypothetical protein